jgi:probable rRNA maturation factor
LEYRSRRERAGVFGAFAYNRGLMSVALHILGTRFSLARHLHAVLRCLRISRGTWTVKVAGDREMADLHWRTRRIAGTTDVLTFDLREKSEDRRQKTEDQQGVPVELDTVLCADEARRRANELGHTVREELLLYCVHSLLHVQGFDDVTAAGARRMHEREDEVLEAIGVGAVYATGKTKVQRRKTNDRSPKSKARRS